MSPTRHTVVLVFCGLIVAAFAVASTAALVWDAGGDRDPGTGRPHPEAAFFADVASSTSQPVQRVATQPPQTTVLHLATPPPQIEGISEAVARVLVAYGFAEAIGSEDPTGQLADSIVEVLGTRGITLHVPEDTVPRDDAP